MTRPRGPRYGRKDANHNEIAAAFCSVGASVLDLSAVGTGCPDLAVGYHGTNYLVEVKDGKKPPSARKLTPDQKEFFAAWRGQKCVVQNVDEALEAIGAM